MSDDEMEDYGFEYTDEEEQEEDVDVENQYYNSKGMTQRPLRSCKRSIASPQVCWSNRI